MITVDDERAGAKRGMIWRFLVLGAIALVLGYVVGAPYLTFYQLQQAVANHDPEALRDLVDFDRVRDSIKVQLTRSLMRAGRAQEAAGNAYSGFGESLGLLMIGPMVDAMVTPSAIAGMIDSGNLPDPKAAATTTATGHAIQTSLHYSGLNHFVFDVVQVGSTGRLRMLLCREGFGWRLCDVQLPNLP